MARKVSRYGTPDPIVESMRAAGFLVKKSALPRDYRKVSADRSRRPSRHETNDKVYIFFSAHVLVAASHTPPALAQSAAVFAVFTSWAKEGPAKASARAIANMEIRVFMSFLPYAVLNQR